MIRRGTAAGLLLAVVAAVGFGGSDTHAASQAPRAAEPSDYRLDDFRAPTPATLKGARVLTTAEAEALWRAKSAIFVDTMPRLEKPAGLAPGTIWRDTRRNNIPDSIWLPNVGYGALNGAIESYFVDSLKALTAADPDRLLVFYCETDCWMSWNAARRAIQHGFRAVAWYPDGSDGWAAAGLPLDHGKPYERTPK